MKTFILEAIYMKLNMDSYHNIICRSDQTIEQHYSCDDYDVYSHFMALTYDRYCKAFGLH